MQYGCVRVLVQNTKHPFTCKKGICTRIIFGTHTKYSVREKNCLVRVQNLCENPSLLGRNQTP